MTDDIGPPGQWRCPTCGFVLMKMKLRASDMAVGVDARPVEDVCPNDGASLRPKTWKEDALDSDRVGREQMHRADIAEQERDAAVRWLLQWKRSFQEDATVDSVLTELHARMAATP